MQHNIYVHKHVVIVVQINGSQMDEKRLAEQGEQDSSNTSNTDSICQQFVDWHCNGIIGRSLMKYAEQQVWKTEFIDL